MTHVNVPLSLVMLFALGACAHPMSPIPDERNDVLQYILIAPVPLSQAVTAAEEKTAGKAIKAALVRAGGDMRYEVVLTAQGKLHVALVDPVNGQVVRIDP